MGRAPEAMSKSDISTALALSAPLQRVSSTLQDVRRNGETLLSTAQKNLSKFSQQEKLFTKNNRVVRKSASEANLQLPRFTRALAAPREAPVQVDNWLAGINNQINQARDKSTPKFQLPSPSQFQEQVSIIHHATHSAVVVL